MSAPEKKAELDGAPLFSIARGPHGLVALKVPGDELGTRNKAGWVSFGPSGWSILRITADNAEGWTWVAELDPDQVYGSLVMQLRRLVEDEESGRG